MRKLKDFYYNKELGFIVNDVRYDDNAVSFIQDYFLNFCCCGDPDGNILYVRDGLEHINRLKEEVWSDRITHDEWKAIGIQVFGNEKAEYFFYYWVDKMGFTEHGGSVPGWLSDKGLEILSLINEALEWDGVKGD